MAKKNTPIERPENEPDQNAKRRRRKQMPKGPVETTAPAPQTPEEKVEERRLQRRTGDIYVQETSATVATPGEIRANEQKTRRQKAFNKLLEETRIKMRAEGGPDVPFASIQEEAKKQWTARTQKAKQTKTRTRVEGTNEKVAALTAVSKGMAGTPTEVDDEAADIERARIAGERARVKELRESGPTTSDVLRGLGRGAEGSAAFDAEDEPVGGEGSVGGLSIGPSGEVTGGTTYQGARRVADSLLGYDIDENDPLGPGSGWAGMRELTAEQEADAASSLKGEPRQLSAEDQARAARLETARREVARESRIAGAAFTPTRMGQGEVKPGVLNPALFYGTSQAFQGPSLQGPPLAQALLPALTEAQASAVRERMPATPDVPLEPTTVKGLKRRQDLVLGSETGEPLKRLATGNPPVQESIVENPDKPYGLDPQLTPVPTEQSRESIDRTFIAPWQDLITDALKAKNMTEAVRHLDVVRSTMPRTFDPSKGSSAVEKTIDVDRDKAGEIKYEDGEPVLLSIQKRYSGALRRPSRRQALANLADIDPERYASLKNALSAGGVRSTTGAAASTSRILDLPIGDTTVSPQFLGHIESAMDIYNRNLKLAESVAGRRQLIESGERVPAPGSPIVDESGKIQTVKGGLKTVEGDELKDIVDPETYAREAERAAKSPDIGFAVTPLRPRSRGEQTAVAGVTPLPATDATVERGTGAGNVRARLDRYLAYVESEGGAEGLAAVRSELIRMGGARLGNVPVTKGPEMDPLDPAFIAAQAAGGRPVSADATTLRDVVNANFATAARGRRALAMAAGVLQPKQTGAYRFSSGKEALIEGGEDKVTEGLEEAMQPVSGAAQPAGIPTRTGTTTDIGLGSQYTTNASGAATISSAYRRFRNRLGERFRTQNRRTSSDPDSRVLPEGPIPPIKPRSDWFYDAQRSGRMDVATILPGGSLAEPISETHPLAGLSSEELEARRVSALESTPQPRAERSLPNPPIDRTATFPHVRDILSGRRGGNVVESPEARESRIVSESMGSVAFAGGPMAQIPGAISSVAGRNPAAFAGLERRAPAATPSLAVARGTEALRRGGAPGVILPPGRVRTAEGETISSAENRRREVAAQSERLQSYVRNRGMNEGTIRTINAMHRQGQVALDQFGNIVPTVNE